MAQSPSVSRPTTARREAATLAPVLVALGVLLARAAGPGAAYGDLVLACVVVLVGHVLPGAVLWRLVRPERGWLVEDLLMGLGIGAALAVPGHVLAVALGVPRAGIALPVGAALLVLAVPATRRRVVDRRVEELPWAWGAAATAAALVPALIAHRAFAQPIGFRGWAVQYVDVPYHTALAHAVSEGMPPHYPQVATEALTYHWFAHAWGAQVSAVSGTGVDVWLWRTAPALLAVLVPVLAAVVAMRVTRAVWAGPAAGAVAFLLTDVLPWATTGMTSPLALPMSPTQQYGMLVMLTLVGVLTVRWRGEASRAGLPLLVVMLVVTGGSKGSTLPVIVAGALVALGAVLIARARPVLRVVALDAALATVTLLLLNRLLFGGGDGGVALDFGQDFVANRGSQLLGREVELGTPLGVLALVLATLPFLLAVLGALGLLVEEATRRDPVAWLLLGGGGAGLGAMIAFTHAGGSQGYFYKAGEPLLAFAGVWGATVLWERSGARRGLLLAGLLVGPAALLVTRVGLDPDGTVGLGRALLTLGTLLALVGAASWLCARRAGSGRRGAVAVAAISLLAAGVVPTVQQVAEWEVPATLVSDTGRPQAISSRDVAALRWLARASERGDLVATNRHCLGRETDPCDRRVFFVAAYSGRNVLIEGWTYNRRAAVLYDEHGSHLFSDSLFFDPELLTLNDGFIERPTATGARALWERGVRWIVVWDRAPHATDLAPYAERVRRGATLRIYRLNRPDR